jgi:hypothetical protein
MPSIVRTPYSAYRAQRARTARRVAALSLIGALVAVFALTGCSSESPNPTAVLAAADSSAKATSHLKPLKTASLTAPAGVTDLAVASVTDTSLTITFTQVANGTGSPSTYEVRSMAGPITWWLASAVSKGSCKAPLAGTMVGTKMSCSITGLAASTTYGVQVVSYRGVLNVNAVFGALSNAVTGTTAAPPPPAAPPAPPAGGTASLFWDEKFEDASFSSRGWYDNTSAPTSTTVAAPGSTRSLMYRWAPGASTPTGGAAMRKKFPASNSIYVSYDVKYSDNYIGSNKSYHPHEFHVLSTMDGDWDGLSNNWMTLYIEQYYSSGGRPRMSMQDNKAVNTSYGSVPYNLVGVTENRSTAGCNGMAETGMQSECWAFAPWYNLKQLTGPVAFQPTAGTGYKGNWNKVEAYFQLNTVVNGIGQKDGIMQYWFNGQLLIDKRDVLFRTGARASLMLDKFVIAPYIGDGSPVDQTMWIDNLRLAARR